MRKTSRLFPARDAHFPAVGPDTCQPELAVTLRALAETPGMPAFIRGRGRPVCLRARETGTASDAGRILDNYRVIDGSPSASNSFGLQVNPAHRYPRWRHCNLANITAGLETLPRLPHAALLPGTHNWWS